MRWRLTDVIVATCIAGMLVLLALAISQKHANYAQTECSNNLKMIHLDYANFLFDHGNFVTRLSTNHGGTMELTNQLTNAAVQFQALVFEGVPPFHRLVCPLDRSVHAAMSHTLANSNLSYFLSLNPPAEEGRWILSGNRNLSFSGESRTAAWNAAIGLHGEAGYLLFLDGSVSKIDSVGLETSFSQGGNATNQIAIP
jgi:hypothetical protein